MTHEIILQNTKQVHGFLQLCDVGGDVPRAALRRSGADSAAEGGRSHLAARWRPSLRNCTSVTLDITGQSGWSEERTSIFSLLMLWPT